MEQTTDRPAHRERTARKKTNFFIGVITSIGTLIGLPGQLSAAHSRSAELALSYTSSAKVSFPEYDPICDHLVNPSGNKPESDKINSGGSLNQSASIEVLPGTIIHVNSSNEPVSALTNNGKEPNCGDIFFIVGPNGDGHFDTNDLKTVNQIMDVIVDQPNNSNLANFYWQPGQVFQINP